MPATNAGERKTLHASEGFSVLADPMLLGHEIPQPVSRFTFPQTQERAVSQLADSLPGYPHHPADFLERPAVAVVQSEVEAQHLGVSGRQSRQGGFDVPSLAVGHGAHVGAFLLTAGEPLDPLVAFAIPGGMIETYRFGVECAQ